MTSFHASISVSPVQLDGHITLEEANEWYSLSNGEPLFADINKVRCKGH